MKTSSDILAIIGALSLSFTVAAQDQEPLSVLEALPSAEVLGPHWSREISLLFDPASKPAEIVGASARLPDSCRNEKRNAVENPTNRISGWCHAHFIFQATNRTHQYEVQVDRYRSKGKVADDFRQLLALDTKEYQKTKVQGIGEAAVVYRNANGMTLWFRRGNFRVWISPLFGSSRWEDDSGLQHLARAFDTRLPP